MIKVVLSISLCFVACKGDEGTTTPTPTVPSAPAPEANLPWRERTAAKLTEMDFTRRTELATLAPRPGEHGLRFTTDVIRDPRATVVFLDRLTRHVDAPEVRVALAEALPRTTGPFADAVPELLADEGDVMVRMTLVATARQAPTTQLALAILRCGFSDAAVAVRSEAARTATAVAGGTQLAAELRTVLADPDPTLRVEAARSLGTLKIVAAQEQLQAALADGSAEVRLEALRALDLIAPGSLSGTAAATALKTDPDERVAQLAIKLAARTK